MHTITMRKLIISPSLLSADFLSLRDEIEMINRSNAEWLHLDVMDGTFVPNLSFGFPMIKAVSRACRKVMDAHFMIVNPMQYVDNVAKHGCDIMSFHYEACSSYWMDVVEKIHKRGMKAGVAIKPGTSVDVFKEILPYIDIAMIMSVEPGFGGQTFIPKSIDKIKWLRREIDEHGYNCLIEVDGGINEETAPLVVAAGADVLVAGTYVFGSENSEQTIDSMLSLQTSC